MRKSTKIQKRHEQSHHVIVATHGSVTFPQFHSSRIYQQMDSNNPAVTFTTVISRLSGPDISPLDIEWASDLPAGRLLLQQLAGLFDIDGDDLDFQESIGRVALDAEELQM